ncbi:MAG TPA: SusD/RagB family nutrient-binding outer membrane lipoprotein [Gemmatimonadaceae bacterium]|nr:SusD/RagB family nutrient-binding outer membrane lipoprotein [Gemmatimonadaceae bacterium]
MNHTKLFTAAAALALSLSACNTDKLTNLNVNPNNPADVPTTSLFTAALDSGANHWFGSFPDMRGGSLLTQHLAEVQYPDEDRYTRLTGGSTTTWFDAPYTAELEDLQQVVDRGLAAKEPGIYGPGLVMRTWNFGYLTDSWGDIPYSQALKASPSSDPTTLKPQYDMQKDIYADFFATLDKVSKDIQASNAGSLGRADLIYSGDLLKWQRFANSLRARFAMRLVNVDPATADAQLRAAFSAPGGVFQSNADNAALRWPGDGIYNNPWAVNFASRDDHRISRVLMEILKTNNDPRLPIYAQPAPSDGQYRGAPNGVTAAKGAPYIALASRPGAVFYPGTTTYGFFGGTGNSFPNFLMTYAELAFIQAEAAQRGIGGLTGSAASYYNAGVQASMEQWGVTGAAAAAYLAQPGVVYVPGTEGLRRIAQQKWVALYTDGLQAWAEWRRTCVPATVQPGPDAQADEVPRRLQYSDTEYSVNATNLETAATRQGGDDFSGRMYWDSKPTAAPTYFAGCGQRGVAPQPAP